MCTDLSPFSIACVHVFVVFLGGSCVWSINVCSCAWDICVCMCMFARVCVHMLAYLSSTYVAGILNSDPHSCLAAAISPVPALTSFRVLTGSLKSRCHQSLYDLELVV